MKLPRWMRRPRPEYSITGLGVFNGMSAGPWHTEMEAHEYARDHQPFNINGYTLNPPKGTPRLYGPGSNPMRH